LPSGKREREGRQSLERRRRVGRWGSGDGDGGLLKGYSDRGRVVDVDGGTPIPLIHPKKCR